MGLIISSFSFGQIWNRYTPIPTPQYRPDVIRTFTIGERFRQFKVPLTFKTTIIQAFSLSIPDVDVINAHNKIRRGSIHRRR